MSAVTRRQALAGLLGLTACSRRTVLLSPIETNTLTLGWRWVPGQELRYRFVIERIAGTRERPIRVRRAEEWRYLVRTLDLQNVAHLEGQLLGLGAGVTVGDTPLPETLLADATEEERRQGETVSLQVSMDGRLVHCSATPFSSLPHRLLALRMPRTPITLYDEWPDPDIVPPFSALLPPELDVSATSSVRLLDLSGERPVLATLETQSVVRTRAGGPSILVSGTALWNASTGHLTERSLEAQFAPSSEHPVHAPGRLIIRSTQL